MKIYWEKNIYVKHVFSWMPFGIKMAIYSDYIDSFNVSGNGSFVSDLSYIADESLWEHVIEDFKQSQFTLNEPTTIILMVLYVPIFLTSLIGNLLVLLVIVPNQRMWTVTNNFLVNLAVADLLGSIIFFFYISLKKS